MSYPRDLDEYDDDELREELKRRAKLLNKGLCSYCKRPVGNSACRFPDRHSMKGKKSKTPVIVVGDTAYELSQAFCEGALALHDRIPYNTGNPYHHTDDRHDEWSNGHEIADDESVGFTREKAEKALAKAKKRRL